MALSSVAIDRLLAVLVLAMAGTGLATLRAGTPSTGWIYVAHGLLAGALVVAIALKLRRSVPRAARAGRRARLLYGLAVTLVAAAALSGGYLWVAGGTILSVGSWTLLTLHAWAGLALVPLVVIHLLPRRWRLLRPGSRRERKEGRRAGRDPAPRFGNARGPSRRGVLAGLVLGLAGVAGYGTAALSDRLQGGRRRFTGSRFLPSGGIPPPTTFFGEPTPPMDPRTWRLTVSGRVGRPLRLDLAGLVALGEVDAVAVLDCTSGWAMETTWRGVPLGRVLDAAAPDAAARRSVTVRAVTGWSTTLDENETRDALLATAVAGNALPAGNGAPVRLVVPGRRGLDWIKWVSDISVA